MQYLMHPTTPVRGETRLPVECREGAPTSGVLRDLHRIRGEFLEMPGLRLTVAQATRLWNIDALVCEALLESLVDTRFLARTADGAYLRSDQIVGRAAPQALRHD